MRLPALAAALALVVLVSGCVPQSPAPVPSPAEPSYTPLFASDEEALAAAEEAYREYQAMSNLIANEGWQGPDRINPFVTTEFAAELTESVRLYAEDKLRMTGAVKFDSTSLQQFYFEPPIHVVIIYICVDVSETQIINSSGADITPTRQERVLLQITLWAEEPSRDLLIAGSEVWDRNRAC